MNNLQEPRIKEFIEQHRWKELRESIADWPAPDLADLLMSMEKPQRVLLFRSLPPELASRVFAELETREVDTFLKDLTDEETRQLLADLPPDDRTNLLEELPGKATQRLLNLLSPADLAEARLLLGFPEESIGRLMTPDYVAVRAHWTIHRAIEHIRQRGKGIENISIIYVVDEYWHLLDALELQRFVLADPDQTVESIMDRSFVNLSAYDDREVAVRTFDRYDLSAVPVVNSEGVLLGVVTIDDVLDVALEEATEDFQKSAGVSPLGENYQDASVWFLYRKRIGWLLALIGVNLVSSGIIAAYEEILSATIALAFFIPLLIDTGGNTGAQSASLMIRDLATGNTQLNQWARTVLKELLEGLILGLTMGIAAYFLGFFRGGIEVAFIVGLSMMLLVFFANLVGISLPFVLTRFNMDPAVASSPLITTLVDALGLFIYFNIATWILNS
jgi:magnesium transporter